MNDDTCAIPSGPVIQPMMNAPVSKTMEPFNSTSRTSSVLKPLDGSGALVASLLLPRAKIKAAIIAGLSMTAATATR